MSDWQVGDLALCVSYGPDLDDWLTNGPLKGSIHKVVGLDYSESRLWLEFDEFPGEGYYHIEFRTVTPKAPDAEDEATIRELNGQPVRETEHAR